MRKTVLTTIFVFVLLVPFLVSAVSNVEIDIKDQFHLGETVYFNYTIVFDKTQEITFIPRIECPNTPVPFLQEKTVQLQEGIEFNDVYYDIEIDEFIEPQTCVAYIQILEPVQQITEKTFEIATDPSFEFYAYLCKDSSCSQKSKIFLLNQDIYFDYSSEVENPEITAILTYPDKKTKQITLPTSIKAEQVGTYTIEATASKEGYKTITKREQFGVIEKAPDIDLVCNYNGVCGGDENHKICPADCPATVSDDIYNIEAECGDSVCQIGENYDLCPSDCENALDGICPNESFICDPDCENFDSEKCKPQKNYLIALIIIIGLIVFIVLIVVGWVVYSGIKK